MVKFLVYCTFINEITFHTYFQLLRQEVDALQERVLKERDEYQAATQSTFPGISAVPFFSVNEKVK